MQSFRSRHSSYSFEWTYISLTKPDSHISDYFPILSNDGSSTQPFPLRPETSSSDQSNSEVDECDEQHHDQEDGDDCPDYLSYLKCKSFLCEALYEELIAESVQRLSKTSSGSSHRDSMDQAIVHLHRQKITISGGWRMQLSIPNDKEVYGRDVAAAIRDDRLTHRAHLAIIVAYHQAR